MSKAIETETTVRNVFIADLAGDMRDHGWTDADTRVRGDRAVVEWTRDRRRAWALIDCTTDRVIGGRFPTYSTR